MSKKDKIVLVLSTGTLVGCSLRHFGDPRQQGTSPCSSPGVGNALAKTLSLTPSAARRTPKVCPCCYLLKSCQPAGHVFIAKDLKQPHTLIHASFLQKFWECRPVAVHSLLRSQPFCVLYTCQVKVRHLAVHCVPIP